MNSSNEKTKLDNELAIDPTLEQALKEFRSSVQTWSEAMYTRPRTALAAAPQQRVWRLAVGWALGVALVAGGVSGGFYERQHRQELAQMEAARMAEQQKIAAAEKVREEEDLLAKVDSEVAREVPSAMEPLAQLMAEDETNK
jgi:hypothetical protein